MNKKEKNSKLELFIITLVILVASITSVLLFNTSTELKEDVKVSEVTPNYLEIETPKQTEFQGFKDYEIHISGVNDCIEIHCPNACKENICTMAYCMRCS